MGPISPETDSRSWMRHPCLFVQSDPLWQCWNVERKQEHSKQHYKMNGCYENLQIFVSNMFALQQKGQLKRMLLETIRSGCSFSVVQFIHEYVTPQNLQQTSSFVERMMLLLVLVYGCAVPTTGFTHTLTKLHIHMHVYSKLQIRSEYYYLYIWSNERWYSTSNSQHPNKSSLHYNRQCWSFASSS